jgi:hypothetical protein
VFVNLKNSKILNFRVLRDNNKRFELEEMLKKTKMNHVLQPKEYHIALKDYKYLIFHCIVTISAQQKNLLDQLKIVLVVPIQDALKLSFSIRCQTLGKGWHVAPVENRSRSLALDFVNVSSSESSSDETRSATPLSMPIEVSQLFMNIIYQYSLP